VVSWPVAFALTQVVELPFYTVGIGHRSLASRVLVGFGASALTHPWVWFVLPPYLTPALGYWGYVAVVELGVVLVEAAYLTGMGFEPRRALMRSALANLASGAAGFGLHALML
jgi:hypothetical protein